MPAKLLVGCSHGAEDALRVTAAYLAAVGGIEQGRPTAMWLTSDGVRLGIAGYCDEIRAAPGAPAVRDLHERLISGGGRMFVCETSLQALTLSAGDLAASATTATAAEVLAWAGEDTLAVSF